jgi:hypothetical protein
VSPNLKNSNVISNNFNVSTYFHSREKIRRPYNLNAPRTFDDSVRIANSSNAGHYTPDVSFCGLKVVPWVAIITVAYAVPCFIYPDTGIHCGLPVCVDYFGSA